MDVISFLSSLEIFSGLDSNALNHILTHLERRSYEPGKSLLTTGEHESTLFILLEGKVKVHNQDFILSILQEGSFFGESALFELERASASVTSITAIDVLLLTSHFLQTLIKDYPPIALNIMRVIRQRLRKQNAEAEQSARRYEGILANSTDIISILDEQGKILFVNPTISDVLGYSPDELNGRKFADIGKEEDAAFLEHILKENFQHEVSQQLFEHKLRHKNGLWLYFESKANFIQYEPLVKGIILNSRDITARKHSEQLEKERNLAIEASKMKEDFLAKMSHEIRTPMNAVMGMTRLLLKTPLNIDQSKYLNTIFKSSETLLHIINDILDLSKIEAGKLEFENIDFNIRDVMETSFNLLCVKGEEKGIRMTLQVDKNIPEYVKGDPLRLSQVIMNLGGNSAKFTEKGEIKISCTVLKMNSSSVEVGFKVSDTGIGIPPDKLNKIFESFSQAATDVTRRYGGTGLGLSISKELVERQGGSIKVESEIGQGTIFSFNLAYQIGVRPVNIAAIFKPDVILLSELSGKKVLLAEDNKFNQIVAVELLKSLMKSIEIDIAETGIKVLEKLSVKSYDIILMDIVMPEMDGYEATTAIRRSNNQVPIIALTASATAAEIKKCIEAGANDYISKPFEPDVLIFKMAKQTGLI